MLFFGWKSAQVNSCCYVLPLAKQNSNSFILFKAAAPHPAGRAFPCNPPHFSLLAHACTNLDWIVSPVLAGTPVDVSGEHDIVIHMQHVVASSKGLREQQPAHSPKPTKWCPKVRCLRIELKYRAVDTAHIWHKPEQRTRKLCVQHEPKPESHALPAVITMSLSIPLSY